MVVRLGELCGASSTGGELVVVASAVDVSVVSRLGELCEASWTGGELVVVSSAVGASTVSRLAEVCEASSTGGELTVVAFAVDAPAASRLDEICEAVSRGGELIAVASAVAGIGDVAPDRLFGRCVTPRSTNTRTTPVNSAIVPPKSCFARGVCLGSGGGAMLDRGGAPHEGQAVANELTSFPQS